LIHDFLFNDKGFLRTQRSAVNALRHSHGSE
jgi:hypothetical protein